MFIYLNGEFEFIDKRLKQVLHGINTVICITFYATPISTERVRKNGVFVLLLKLKLRLKIRELSVEDFQNGKKQSFTQVLSFYRFYGKYPNILFRNLVKRFEPLVHDASVET